MANQIVWPKNPETDIASYVVQRGDAETGPFATIATVPADQNYDPNTETYSLSDPTGTASHWYRIAAVDNADQQSDWSDPFPAQPIPETPTGVTVRWAASTDPDIQLYRLERAISISGPWAFISNIPHLIPGPFWDAQTSTFYYVDPAGNSSTWYRITAVDQANQASAPSAPFRASTESTALLPGLVAALSISVGDVGTLINLGLTTIEIWHSEDSGGTWEEITGGAYSPASVLSLKPYTTFRIEGEVLRFTAGGTEYIVTFPTLVNWTAAQVAARINQSLNGAATVVNGCVQLSTVTVGRGATLEVLATPPALGFPLGVSHGKDPRLPLADGVVVYAYYDVSAKESSRYKWRFSANGSAPISKYSAYVTARQSAIMPNLVSLATAKFTTIDGRPSKQKVIVAPEQGSFSSYVLDLQTMVFESDENGLLQVPLVQGAKVRVGLEGSGIVRVITVPNTPTFDLMSAIAEADDEFTVQTYAPLLTRRSL